LTFRWRDGAAEEVWCGDYHQAAEGRRPADASGADVAGRDGPRDHRGPGDLAGRRRGLGITANRLNEVVQDKRGISADTALRLAVYFGTTPRAPLSAPARITTGP
jgi:hypothetical protein